MPIIWNPKPTKPKEKKISVAVGDAVRVKKGSYASLGIGGGPSGGEAILVNISEDKHGTVYTVEMTRNGKRRSVRRDSLVVHYKKNRNRRKTNEGEVRRQGRRPRRGR